MNATVPTPMIHLWQLADGVLVATRADEQAMSGTAMPASVAELMHLLCACATRWHAVAASRALKPVLASPVSLTAFANGECRDATDVVKGSALLVPDSGVVAAIGWTELNGMRLRGLAQLVVPATDSFDDSVLSIQLRRTSALRQGVKLLDLLRFAKRPSTFARAIRSRGRMWVAPLANADDTEVSERCALFEGSRQLPPIPASPSDIQLKGDGRYAITSGALAFSSTWSPIDRPKHMWWVERNVYTDRRLQFISKALRPIAYQRRSSLSEVKAAIEPASIRSPSPLRPGDSVVVLTHALPPGGAERQWCYLAGELKRMGYSVEFVTLWPLQDENAHYLPLLAQEGIRPIQLEQRELDASDMLGVMHVALERIVSGTASVASESPFGSHLQDLTKLFSRLKPRAVFAQLDYCNLVAAAAGILAAVPQIVMSFRNYNPSRFGHFAQEWFQPWYALLTQSPSVVLTGNSRAANADYARWIGIDESRVKLVPNAIDAAAFAIDDHPAVVKLRRQYGLTHHTPVILGVFRLHAEKRPLLFVETFAAVAARMPHVRGFVAGVGPFESAMQKRIDELKLSKSLLLLGRRDDVAQLMRVSSLLLLTSDFEGMPNVLLEAQAMGIPFVASDVGGVADCVVDGHTGFLVNQNDVAGFVQRCIELLQNDQMRARFGANGAAHVRCSFSRRAMAEHYLQALEPHELAGASQPEALRATAV